MDPEVELPESRRIAAPPQQQRQHRSFHQSQAEQPRWAPQRLPRRPRALSRHQDRRGPRHQGATPAMRPPRPRNTSTAHPAAKPATRTRPAQARSKALLSASNGAGPPGTRTAQVASRFRSHPGQLRSATRLYRASLLADRQTPATPGPLHNRPAGPGTTGPSPQTPSRRTRLHRGQEARPLLLLDPRSPPARKSSSRRESLSLSTTPIRSSTVRQPAIVSMHCTRPASASCTGSPGPSALASPARSAASAVRLGCDRQSARPTFARARRPPGTARHKPAPAAP